MYSSINHFLTVQCFFHNVFFVLCAEYYKEKIDCYLAVELLLLTWGHQDQVGNAPRLKTVSPLKMRL